MSEPVNLLDHPYFARRFAEKANATLEREMLAALYGGKDRIPEERQPRPEHGWIINPGPAT